MSRRLERAEQLVDQLLGAGIPATLDPSEVAGKGACVLLTPPALAFDLNTGATCTWRLAVIDGGRTTAGLDTWRRLDALVDQVADLLPVTTGEPAQYAPTPGVDPSPAYLLTLTEGVD
jgi:hypothetical protein